MEIELVNGMTALVDEDDWQWASRHRWHLFRDGSRERVYRMTEDGNRIYLHREVMRARRGQEIGARNKNGLDCRKENLFLGAREGQHNCNWKEAPSRRQTGHGRARRRFPLPEKCDLCDAVPTDRHHKDGNTFNNERENIAFLCRSCHMKVDGRGETLTAVAIAYVKARPKKVNGPCISCEELRSGPYVFGRCHRCDAFWRRNGRERGVSTDLRPDANRARGAIHLGHVDPAHKDRRPRDE